MPVYRGGATSKRFIVVVYLLLRQAVHDINANKLFSPRLHYFDLLLTF